MSVSQIISVIIFVSLFIWYFLFLYFLYKDFRSNREFNKRMIDFLNNQEHIEEKM